MLRTTSLSKATPPDFPCIAQWSIIWHALKMYGLYDPTFEENSSGYISRKQITCLIEDQLERWQWQPNCCNPVLKMVQLGFLCCKTKHPANMCFSLIFGEHVEWCLSCLNVSTLFFLADGTRRYFCTCQALRTSEHFHHPTRRHNQQCYTLAHNIRMRVGSRHVWDIRYYFLNSHAASICKGLSQSSKPFSHWQDWAKFPASILHPLPTAEYLWLFPHKPCSQHPCTIVCPPPKSYHSHGPSN